MTTITRFAGTGDTTMPQLIPDLGLTLTHLWLPKKASTTTWSDQVGTLTLTATLGLGGSVVAPTLAYEGLVPYLDFSGQSYMNDAGATLPAADLRTIVIVARPNTGDTESASSNGGILSDTAVAIRQGVASTSVGFTPTAAGLTAALDKWHMYALSLPAAGVGAAVVDATSVANAAQADLTRVRLLRSSTGAARKMKVAFVATASNTATASDLTTVVYPRLKAWLSPLAWA